MSRKTRTRAAGDFMLAPMVMWLRLPAMAAEARGVPAWPSETLGAVTEKVAAAAEGAVAAQLSLAASAFAFWPEIMAGRVPSLMSGDAAGKSLEAALRPAAKRVRTNYRRLSASARKERTGR